MKNLNPITILLLGLTILLMFSFQSQQEANTLSKVPFHKISKSQWYKMDASARVSVADFLLAYNKDLGLSTSDKWVNYRIKSDELGMTHYRYELFHKDIRVEGSELLVHSKDGFVSHFNGHWVEGLEANTSVTLSANQAIARGMEYVPSTKYMWEDALSEKMLKEVERDSAASFYPDPELVFYNKDFPNKGGSFRTAYKMIIHTHYPQERKLVYVDANNGALLHKLELLEHTSTPTQAIAETKYHGTQIIITDSIGPDSFRLFDSTRGNGVVTLDMNGGTGDANLGVEFTDTDNYWNTVNPEQDEAALDAHFSAEMTFDFYQSLGHNGIDDSNMELRSLVHYDVNLVNAFWNGSWASLGDGNGSNWLPLTSLDVVGHEFTHGVTGNTAGLVYQDESGALNESFSDIFGTAIEFWGDSASADFFIGDDFHVTGIGFRSMSNPNAEGDPDTYLGTNWATGPGDNGGVHTNSGVQNFWFYLLSEGGSGTNDHGTDFVVDGVGIDTSARIAFRNLQFYLTTNSQYEDAYLGAILSAEELYGECSNPATQTVFAWRAVGFGELGHVDDFQILGFPDVDSIECGLTDSYFPTIQLQYNGYACTNTLSANEKIPLQIQVDNGPLFLDTLVLSTDLVGGDIIIFTFDTPVSGLEPLGFHTLSASVNYETDIFENNNNTSFTLENVIAQNTDFANTRGIDPAPDCFMEEAIVAVEVTFQGCGTLEPGSEIFFSYDFNTGPVTESMILNTTLDGDDSFIYTFNTPLELFGNRGNLKVDTWVLYPPDVIPGNDTLILKILNPKMMRYGSLLTYEAADELSLDSFYIQTSEYSDGFMDGIAGFESDLGVVMTGKNGQEAFDGGLINLVSSNGVWNANEVLSAKMCVCVNATIMSTINLDFDLRQTYSFFYENNGLPNAPFSSSMRVLVEDEQVGPTYNPPLNQHLGPWEHHTLDISEYAGQKVEVCFETRNFSSPEFSNWGDRALIDNVEITGVVGTEDITNDVVSFNIHPNPGAGNFIVTYQPTISEPTQLEVYDVHGRMLWSQSIEANNSIDLDLTDFAAGVYYLRLDNGKSILSKALVLAK